MYNQTFPLFLQSLGPEVLLITYPEQVQSPLKHFSYQNIEYAGYTKPFEALQPERLQQGQSPLKHFSYQNIKHADYTKPFRALQPGLFLPNSESSYQ